MLWSVFGSGATAAEVALAILAFICAITIALVMHEFAHAFAAWKSGDPTAKMMGRMSLNPARHVEPLGLLSFVIVGIGWAKPVPVNPFNYRNFKWGNFWVSIGGVLTNFVLGFVFSLCFFVVHSFANLDNYGNILLWHFFRFATVINIALMIFNLLPIPPLDGYNLLRSFTKPNNQFMQFLRNYAMIILIVVLIISMTTGGIFHLVNGIIWMFNSLWGVIF